MFVKNLINQYNNDFIKLFNQLMADRRQYYRDIRLSSIEHLQGIKARIVYITIFIVSFIPILNEQPYNFSLHFLLAFVVLTSTVLFNFYIQKKRFEDSYKDKLLPNILMMFGNITFVPCPMSFLEANIAQLPEVRKSKFLISYSVFKKAKIFDININYSKNGDGCTGQYMSYPFQVCDVEFGNKEQRVLFSKGMFIGTAVHVNLPKKVNRRMLVVPKNHMVPDFENYENKTIEFRNFMKRHDILVEKSPEENDADTINIASLLNPDFAERILELESCYNTKESYFSVYDDSMIFLIKSKESLFQVINMFEEVEEIQQYVPIVNKIISILAYMDVLNTLLYKDNR